MFQACNDKVMLATCPGFYRPRWFLALETDEQRPLQLVTISRLPAGPPLPFTFTQVGTERKRNQRVILPFPNAVSWLKIVAEVNEGEIMPLRQSSLGYTKMRKHCCEKSEY